MQSYAKIGTLNLICAKFYSIMFSLRTLYVAKGLVMNKYLQSLHSMGIDITSMETKWSDSNTKCATQNLSNTFEVFTLVRRECTIYSAGMDILSPEIYKKVGRSQI